MKKQILTIVFILSAVLSYSLPVSAQTTITPGDRREDRLKIRNDRSNLRQDIKNLNQDIKQANKGKGARLLGATVSGVSGSTLTVTKDGRTYAVNTDSSTIFRRHFWGKSSISEISINDQVNVWGKWTDDAKTTIQAKMIRDLSIMKRFGAFVGTISNLNGSTFTLNTVNRGAQSVTLIGSTKCVNRKEQTISCSTDLQNGHRVRVKGMWDAKNKVITEVTQVKDYSLPPLTTPTP